jgi:hypothetical protein
VTLALAACGWLCAFAAAWRVLTLMRRLELMACAEHELRGPLAALSLAAARSRPVPAIVVEGQLERASIALADLTEARRGRRAPSHAGRNDLGTLAERAAAAWDAFEHGGGRPVLRGVRRGNAVRIEVEDRGRGLAIAQRAAEDAGGRLQLTSTRAGTVAAVELPVADE